MYEMYDAVADQRKSSILFEQEKRKYLVLKITLDELLGTALFLSQKNAEVHANREN